VITTARWAAVTSLAVLAACSADSDDFRQSAEDYIEGDRITEQAGTSFTDAQCDEPADAEPGTMFGCTAIADDGAEWRFVVTVVDDGNFEITGQPAAGS
jgi:Domain of unknown function (DUF4333)